MGAPFDHVASTYDSDFTQSAIGQLQRKQVWTYINGIIPELNGIELLEFNCGTGEDAVLFGEKGFNIVATDISTEMLKVTQEKAREYSMQNQIDSHYLDLDNFNETLFDKKFDLVFSNFGGLNCINPESLKSLLSKLPLILKPGGRFIGVIMPKFCAWETVFFIKQLELKKAFRRLTSKGVPTDLQGITTKTWYYQPSQIKTWTSSSFNVVSVKPIGITLPPSYLEQFFSKRKNWLMTLNRFEKKLAHYSFFAGMADHFLIDLKLK